ncbi:MAG: malto-oligosyltrehalose trehalohydrolase, partial [Calditrichota bacterium]
MQVGALYLQDGYTRFQVWAPFPDEVAVKIYGDPDTTHSMEQEDQGYWTVTLENIKPGSRYTYLLDNKKERPDPASHCQPDGVHGPSMVVEHDHFAWSDAGWRNLPLEEMIFYEIHVGTFTPEGTFKAIIPRLAALQDLGVNVLELMPVGQFPGKRNWGYDGVYPYAVQTSYGGPDGLKELVSACHHAGMAVVLDVVYNHLGPEGNYFRDYGPYFTEKYHTPWGSAVNFDDADSDQVRNYFIQNAYHWFMKYHLDGLRLDAVHAIFDMSAKPFLRELGESVEALSGELGRPLYLLPESDLNDTRLIRPRDEGGFQLHAQWSDDFHHAVHTLLTGENDGYYRDFGTMEDLVRALSDGFVYDWRYSKFRRRHHGSSSVDRPAYQFIVCTQNHDQVGNRMLGERLAELVSFESLKLSAGILLCSPCLPLLFMGQEYGEEAPFLYFVSHSDPDLIQAVREGREA